MKKKLLLVFVAIMLLACSTMTVFAQPSVGADAVVDIDKVVDKNGKELTEVVLTELKGEDLSKAQEVVKPENLKEVLPAAEAKEDWKVFMIEAIVVDEHGDEVDWEQIKEQFPIEISFRVPGVTENSRIRILHYYNGWHTETITGNAKDIVKAKFTHLTGPIVILVDNSVPSDDAPKTGENNFVWYASVIAMVALAGAVVVKRKEN